MSKLTNVMDKVSEFGSTPEGEAVMGGVSNALQLGLSALVVKKFFPTRATFGAAIAVGILSVASTAVVGYSAVLQERLKNSMEKDCKTNNLRAQIERMRDRIIQLNTLLSDKGISEKELKDYKEQIRTLKNQLEELQKENEKLSGKVASVQSILREELPEPPEEIILL